MKNIFDMSVAEYQRLVRKCERKYPADVPLSKIPGLRRAGRPSPGSVHMPLLVRSVKMTIPEWQALKRRAKAQHVSVGALIRAFAQSHA